MASLLRAGRLPAIVISVARHLGLFLAAMGCLTLLTISPIVLFIAWFIIHGHIYGPKDDILAQSYAPGLPDVHYRLWRVPWKGLGGGADTFAIELVSLRRHKSVQVFGTDMLPVDILWRDATHLEIAAPNVAFVGNHPREAFGVTVQLRFVPDDPEARRKHFEEIERLRSRYRWRERAT